MRAIIFAWPSENLRTPAHPAGKKWTTVHRKQAVVVAAMTEDERLILIHQERIPVRAAIWEMPAGQVDEENPDRKQIEATALRELEEETGYTLLSGGEMISLGNVFSSPGFTDEEEHLFLVRPVGLSRETKKGEESITDCRAFSIDEIQQMIARNELRDAEHAELFCAAAFTGAGFTP